MTNKWKSIENELPMCSVEDYLSGGKRVWATDGISIRESLVGDHNTWIVINNDVTHWIEYEVFSPIHLPKCTKDGCKSNNGSINCTGSDCQWIKESTPEPVKPQNQ